MRALPDTDLNSGIFSALPEIYSIRIRSLQARLRYSVRATPGIRPLRRAFFCPPCPGTGAFMFVSAGRRTVEKSGATPVSGMEPGKRPESPGRRSLPVPDRLIREANSSTIGDGRLGVPFCGCPLGRCSPLRLPWRSPIAPHPAGLSFTRRHLDASISGRRPDRSPSAFFRQGPDLRWQWRIGAGSC